MNGPQSADAGSGGISVRHRRYLSRELSWLEFNARVLAMAADCTVALLERVKFCAIVSNNLDEFFEVRVAGLKDQVAAGVTTRSLDGQTPREQLSEIGAAIEGQVAEQQRIVRDELLPLLRAEGVRIVSWSELDEADRKLMERVYEDGIYPVLTPLAVDRGHPFPYISNLSLNLATIVREPLTGDQRFARVKVPRLLRRFVAVGEALLPLEDLIASQLHVLFPGMLIDGAYPFRVTRKADLDLEEEDAEDLMAAVELELRRLRFGRAVRLEVTTAMPQEILDLLLEELELDPSDVTVVDGLLGLGGLAHLHDLDRPDLKDEPWTPRTQRRLAAIDEEADMFAAIAQGDVLVHHPYDSFVTSVERFVAQAAADPDVLTIKLTLYRTSGDSPVVNSLIQAAERGKQVVVLIELKARFDEQANIAWARALEEAGVHVVYGLVGLKTHTKVALVVRAEGDRLRRYCHVATGNYNSATARLYEDIGLFSASAELGDDLSKLFNYLTGFSQPVAYQHLLTAPAAMRHRMLELIEAETRAGAGGSGAIVMKLNSLADQQIIDALYAASHAGVKIELIVRGICCLRPGVEGLSENITVRSLVGRFLEHSRIFRFANACGPGEPGWFIGSADMMPRNLDRRVEAIVPVTDPALAERLDEILYVVLADNTLAWDLDSVGNWHRVADGLGPDLARVDAQISLQRIAASRTAS